MLIPITAPKINPTTPVARAARTGPFREWCAACAGRRLAAGLDLGRPFGAVPFEPSLAVPVAGGIGRVRDAHGVPLDQLAGTYSGSGFLARSVRCCIRPSPELVQAAFGLAWRSAGTDAVDLLPRTAVLPVRTGAVVASGHGRSCGQGGHVTTVGDSESGWVGLADSVDVEPGPESRLTSLLGYFRDCALLTHRGTRLFDVFGSKSAQLIGLSGDDFDAVCSDGVRGDGRLALGPSCGS